MSDDTMIRELFDNWIKSTTKMAGHSLSILEKRNGLWQILRDANTLTVVPE